MSASLPHYPCVDLISVFFICIQPSKPLSYDAQVSALLLWQIVSNFTVTIISFLDLKNIYLSVGYQQILYIWERNMCFDHREHMFTVVKQNAVTASEYRLSNIQKVSSL
jgi:hypothetical protein